MPRKTASKAAALKKCLHARPPGARNDLRYRPLADAVATSQCALRDAADRVFSSDRQHIRFAQLRGGMGCSTRRVLRSSVCGMSSLGSHVKVVVPARSGKEMIRPHTSGVVASVADTGRQVSVGDSKRRSMRERRNVLPVLFHVEASVPAGIYGALPLPARVAFSPLNEGCETIRQVFRRMRHG